MENEFMRLAIREAVKAGETGEVPVGAVIVKDGRVIAAAHNTKERDACALCHAEISAIGKASRALESWRLRECDMYVTLEPCLMCTGAISEAGIRRLYFGAYDKANGHIVSNPPGVRGLEYYCGIMEDECTRLLKEFFKAVRK